MDKIIDISKIEAGEVIIRKAPLEIKYLEKPRKIRKLKNTKKHTKNVSVSLSQKRKKVKEKPRKVKNKYYY